MLAIAVVPVGTVMPQVATPEVKLCPASAPVLHDNWVAVVVPL
jgi:hypothetical protein